MILPFKAFTVIGLSAPFSLSITTFLTSCGTDIVCFSTFTAFLLNFLVIVLFCLFGCFLTVFLTLVLLLLLLKVFSIVSNSFLIFAFFKSFLKELLASKSSASCSLTKEGGV